MLSGSIANLVLLVALTVLSVYKPWGRMSRGRAVLNGALDGALHGALNEKAISKGAR